MKYLLSLLFVLICIHLSTSKSTTDLKDEKININGITAKIPGSEDVWPEPIIPTITPNTTIPPTVTTSKTTTSSTVPTSTSSTTTTPASTSVSPKTTTVKPTSTSEKPSSTSEKPTTTTKPSSTVSPNSTTSSTTTTTTTTTAKPDPTPEPHRRFDGPSFVGGIVLAVGLTAIGFVAFKFYKARLEVNYHTL